MSGKYLNHGHVEHCKPKCSKKCWIEERPVKVTKYTKVYTKFEETPIKCKSHCKKDNSCGCKSQKSGSHRSASSRSQSRSQW